MFAPVIKLQRRLIYVKINYGCTKMKKTVYLIIVVVIALLFSSVPVQAVGHDGHGGGHGGGHDGHFSFGGSVWLGPGWGWGPWWWGPSYYPYYPYYPYYYGEPPVVIEQQPQTYDEPAPQQQQAEDQYYWYFCPESKNYYPYVKKCPKGWLKVVPPPAPSDYKE